MISELWAKVEIKLEDETKYIYQNLDEEIIFYQLEQLIKSYENCKIEIINKRP